MAWIVRFDEKSGSGKRQPTDVVAQVKVFDVSGSTLIVQIDTFGSDDREIPGKQSQTLQMGEEAAAQLFRILQKTYGF
jgi:hypothetical protein